MDRVRVTFWGVRGSMATPGPKTVRFGGNTACVEIEAAGRIIVCDAGTGIRDLGIDLKRRFKKGPISAYILLSHLHWDHYIGLPFFKPLYEKGNRFVIAGPRADTMGFGKALSLAMRPPYFPIPFSVIPAGIRLKTLSERTFRIGRIMVKPLVMNHPGGALGWRFFFPGGRSVVHITDNEPATKHKEARLVDWMRGADVLIHDAQYDPRGYKRHLGWGHSPFTYPLELAEKAGIKRIFLFHFDPEDEDRHLDRVLRQARRLAHASMPRVRVGLTREGLTITL